MTGQQPMCIICAWRSTCQKQFSLKAGQKCPDFVKDVTVKIQNNEEKQQNDEKKS